MIGSDEIAREREERIMRLKEEFAELKQKLDIVEVAYGTL